MLLLPFVSFLVMTADAAPGIVGAAQIDAGLYDLDTFDGTKWLPSGFVEVHDVPGSGAPQRHEHWYVDPKVWSPTAAKIRFQYHQASLGHGKLPANTAGHTHYGFLIERGSPDVAVTPPGSLAAVSCTNAHLCETFHTLSNAGGTVFGYANVWKDGAGKLQEMYILDPLKFVPPSPATCSTEWQLALGDSPLPKQAPTSTEGPERRRTSTTEKWDYRWAKQDGGTSAEPGTTGIPLGPRLPCPP